MEIVNAVGKGVWVNNKFVAEMCPICSGEDTFRLLGGSGLWECVECKNQGDIDDLKRLAKDPFVVSALRNVDKPAAPDGLIVVSSYKQPKNLRVIGTGFNKIDKMLGGLPEGALTVMTGKRGDGKSTFAGQLALNAVNDNHSVCFYSGELNAYMFQQWVLSQAAGANFMNNYVDRFGATRYQVDSYAEPRIKEWLGEKLIIYDNSVVKSSERNTIIERFTKAREYYGCDLFFVDNLMTARYPIDNDRDYYRAQSNFVGDLVDFALQNKSHVVLVAHPRKGNSGDINDDVAGIADVTNRATNVLKVSRATDKEKAEMQCDSIVSVAKNRSYGELGKVPFGFDVASRRFTHPDMVSHYGWEDLC